MNVQFLIPALALLGIGSLLGLVSKPLPSKLAVRALTLVAVMVGVTVASVVVATAAGFVLGPARRAELIEYCRIFPLHHEVGRVQGVLSLVAVAMMVIRVAIVLGRRHRAMREAAGRRISVLETSRPLAYAVPGDPGCVVVSTGLLSALDPRERQVVFAHERAHLRQQHHRYLLAGSIADAVVPTLRPLVNRLRLATERCADEEAVAALGGNRQLVANAITKAAFATSSFGGVVPAFGGGSVAARVDALVGRPQSESAAVLSLVIILAGAVAAVAAGATQLHHLWVLMDHVCHGLGVE